MRVQKHVSDADLLLAIDRELSSRDLQVVDTHIARCGRCAARRSDFQAAIATRDAVASEGRRDGAAAPAARARLARALRTADVAPPRLWPRLDLAAFARASMLPAVALAGAVILLLVGPAVRHRFESSGGMPLPNATLTPGAVSSLTTAALCGGARPSRVVTVASRQTVLRGYQMERVPESLFELDALVTPELGGTTAPANLWPQRYDSPVWNAVVKDQLERLLPELVCSRRLALSEAQHDIATDWVAAYKKYFRTDVPLEHYADGAVEDDDLVFERSAPEWHSGAGLVRSLGSFQRSLFLHILLPVVALHDHPKAGQV